MRIPKTPPQTAEILNDLIGKRDLDQLKVILDAATVINTHSGYLHWEKLRFKDAPLNLSPEEHWYVIKQARRATLRYLPFDPIRTNEHKLHFTRPDCLLSALNRLDIQTGGHIAAPKVQISKQDAHRYLQRSFLEEPFNSSVLEGAVTTRERARILIETGETPNSVSDQMVVNNYYAMSFIKDNLNDDLTPQMIMETQRIITDGTLDRPEMAGQFRDTNDIIVGDDFGNVFHTPPAFDQLPDRLQAICDFANAPTDNSNPFVHPLVKAIILHFMIAYDHPFIDGNGRTARAFFYWYALRSGYWMIEYTSISAIINQAPTQYGLAYLNTETDENDLTYFIMHQVDILEKSIAKLQDYIRRQRDTYSQVEKTLADTSLNHRQKHLLSDMIKGTRSVAEISAHEKLHSVSYLTARKDLEALVNAGWLIKEKIGRNSVYFKGKRLNAVSGS